MQYKLLMEIALQSWIHRLDPDTYLSRYPTGYHARLAESILSEKLVRFERSLTEALLPAAETLKALFDLFGSPFLLGEGECRTSHGAVREWLRNTIPGPDLGMWNTTYRVQKRHALLAQRELVRQFGVLPHVPGSLGTRKSLPIRPKFWTLKLSPKEYVWRFGGQQRQSKSQKLHLAAAALVPFEQEIEREWQCVEAALQSIANRYGTAASQPVEYGLKLAARHIVYSRYEGNQSIEHYRQFEARQAESKSKLSQHRQQVA